MIFAAAVDKVFFACVWTPKKGYACIFEYV